MTKKKTKGTRSSSASQGAKQVRYGPAGLELRAKVAETDEGRRALARTDAMLDAIAPLSAAMEEQGVTHKELAKRLGVKRQRVGQILSGGENLSLETLAEAYHVLGLRLLIGSKPLSGMRHARSR